MNVERPKNGTERALILHSWLISKWTWASRHIFWISHMAIHTQRGFPPSHLGPKLYLPNLTKSPSSLCRPPLSVWTLPILCTIYPPPHLMLNASLTALVCCSICIFGNVAITFALGQGLAKEATLIPESPNLTKMGQFWSHLKPFLLLLGQHQTLPCPPLLLHSLSSLLQPMPSILIVFMHILSLVVYSPELCDTI